MIEDEKIIEMFFERSEQGIRELDIKYGTVCHNLSYHIVGSRQNAEECVNDAYLGVWNTIPPARPNPLLSYVLKELARIIESFLDTLTTENRVIFMRRYWFSDSYKDIAEVVGLSEKNVSVRLTRIREKMKQYLIEREVFI